MSASEFITIESVATQGALPALTRSLLLVTRESVSGYSPDSQTGLIKINSTDYDGFVTANPTKYGLINALRVTFNQNYSYQYVYILSKPSGLSTSDLDNANRDPRAWSIISYVERYNGGGTGGSGSADYFTDLGMISTWGVRAHRKVVLHTYSMEEGDSLPYELLLGGDINKDGGFLTIVSDSKSTLSGNTVYDNIALAWASYCINGPAVSRSWGSLSDAHDFELIDGDSYTNTTRATIANNSLAQYNGAKDRAGSLFVYDTQMNSDVNPPDTDQVETVLAGDYIEDYTYVLVHNTLQAAGQTGLPNDDAGILTLLGIVRKSLNDCYALNLILSKPDLSPDFAAGCLTALQVTQRAPTWKQTGIWPSGTVFATIKRFGAAHYVTINFTYP